MFLSEITWGNREHFLDPLHSMPHSEKKAIVNRKRDRIKTLEALARKSNVLKRKFLKILKRTEAMLASDEQNFSFGYFSNPLLEQRLKVAIDWETLPAGTDPMDGGLNGERAIRKRQQIENLAAIFQVLLSSNINRLPERPKVVEFCSGSGYAALPLAAMFPHCQFVLLDMKKRSLDIAYERIHLSGLTNVEVVHGLVQDFTDAFDIGLALHACGEATDLTEEKCLAQGAAYILCPCCVGKVQNSALVQYPRSKKFRNSLEKDAYISLAKAADFGHREIDEYTDEQKMRRVCKAYVEIDRNLMAEDYGYNTRLYLMIPPSATPKNDILFGWPQRFDSEALQQVAGQKLLCKLQEVLQCACSQSQLLPT